MPNDNEIPETPDDATAWLRWTPDETLEHFRNVAASCDECESTYLVRYSNPPSADTDGDDWVRTNALNVSRRTIRDGDLLFRHEHLDSLSTSMCTSPHMDSNFEYSGNSYSYLCDYCHDAQIQHDRECRNEQENPDDDDEEQSSPHVHSYSHRRAIKFFTAINGDVIRVTGSHQLATDAGRNGLVAVANGAYNMPVQKPVCGFELEMSDESGRTPYAEAALLLHRATEDFAYMKEDGSVGNGFELVTHPHTLEAYQLRMPMWDALDTLRGQGWRSWSSSSSCGLHIHINNASFVSVGHAMRFLRFVYTNREPLVRFAGRESHYAKFEYDSFVQRQVHTGYDDVGAPIYESQTVADVVKKKQRNQDRYLAVNVQNDNTYELRFFRGSMKPTTVLACLEFVFALHEYTETMTSHDVLVNRALGWRSFLAFVRTKSATDNFRYRNLLNRLLTANRNPDTGFLNMGESES